MAQSEEIGGTNLRRTIDSFLVTGSSGCIFGTTLGMISLYIVFEIMNTSCNKFKSMDACNSLQHSSCVWANNSCLWADHETVNCSSLLTADDCGQIDSCTYDYKDDKCEHIVGLSPLKTGLYAAFCIGGGLFGPLMSDWLLKKYNFRWTVRIAGIVALTGGVFFTLGRLSEQFWLILLGRLLHSSIGFAACSFGPLYSRRRMSSYVALITGGYQTFANSTMLIIALYGWMAEPRTFNEGDVHMELRIHFYIAFLWFFAIVLIIVSFVVVDPPPEVEHHGGEDEANEDEQTQSPKSTTKMTAASNNEKGPRCDTRTSWFFFVGFMLSTAMLWTGVGAVIAFGPVVVKRAGIGYMVANVLLMLAKTLGALVAIPLARFFQPRKMYLWGTGGVCVCCFIAAVGAHPDILGSNGARNTFLAMGILGHLFVFMSMVGPFYFILSMLVYPADLRHMGAAWVNTATSGHNVIQNLIFPVLVVVFSGGLAGDQDKGISIWFFIFGIIAIISIVVLYFFLQEQAHIDPTKVAQQKKQHTSPNEMEPTNAAPMPTDAGEDLRNVV